jgi:hypothetical protein
VEEFLVRDGIESTWRFDWRRNLFQWEIDLLGQLLEMLEPITLTEEEDCWKWVPEPEGNFSVSSAYNYLDKEFRALEGNDSEVEVVFSQIW